MTLTEEHRDLFTVPDDYYLAHCIASDLGMGAGIAVQFRRRFGLTGRLNALRPLHHPTCVVTGRVFNLVTKKRSGGKPTYATLRASLERMKALVLEHQVARVAVPKIGCGLDGLQWPMVRQIIQEVFADVDVEIRICVWR
jgi:O-acetyl-ADP-ribose deacetylase (regulator of RNase III)